MTHNSTQPLAIASTMPLGACNEVKVCFTFSGHKNQCFVFMVGRHSKWVHAGLSSPLLYGPLKIILYTLMPCRIGPKFPLADRNIGRGIATNNIFDKFMGNYKSFQKHCWTTWNHRKRIIFNFLVGAYCVTEISPDKEDNFPIAFDHKLLEAKPTKLIYVFMGWAGCIAIKKMVRKCV